MVTEVTLPRRLTAKVGNKTSDRLGSTSQASVVRLLSAWVGRTKLEKERP